MFSNSDNFYIFSQVILIATYQWTDFVLIKNLLSILLTLGSKEDKEKINVGIDKLNRYREKEEARIREDGLIKSERRIERKKGRQRDGH